LKVKNRKKLKPAMLVFELSLNKSIEISDLCEIKLKNKLFIGKNFLKKR
jgi:hypothetical protein